MISFFFVRLLRHCFKNICVPVDPVKTTQHTVVHIPAYRCKQTVEGETEQNKKKKKMKMASQLSIILLSLVGN